MSAENSKEQAKPIPVIPRRPLFTRLFSWLRKPHASPETPLPQKLQWTPQLVEHFWTGFSKTKLVEHSFAPHGGKGLIAAVAHLLPKEGRILDFGAGDGDLIEFMCQRGLHVSGYEPSQGRRQHLQDKLGKYPRFMGIVDISSREKFDVVMMVEVIEHILDEQLHGTLAKIARFTRAGGYLIVSTPNNEDLELGMCYDPVNNTLFHRWQHVRSFTRGSLATLLGQYGFEEVVTHELEFNNALYVPYDEAWGSNNGAPIPSYLAHIRANRPVRIGAQNSLLYIGRRSKSPAVLIVDKSLQVADEVKQRVVAAPSNAARFAKVQARRLLGRHYEPWIKHPHSMPHPWRLIAVGGRWAQLRARNCQCMPAKHPLRWLAYPLLQAIVRVVERHYGSRYRQFGDAVRLLTHDAGTRNGILLVSGTLSFGGSERQTVLTALGFASRKLQPVNVAVVYLHSEAQQFYLHKLEAAGMRVLEIGRDLSKDNKENYVWMPAIRKLPTMIHDVACYARTFAEQKPQTLHLWLDEVNIKGGLAAVATGVPRIILSGRNLPPNNYLLYQPYMREAYRWLLQQPGVTLINNTSAGARAYEQWLGLSEGSVQVVHNGFDFDETVLTRCRERRADYRERHGISPTALVVGTVIRLNEEKQPLLWAEIAARLGRVLPEAHFLVVGEGPLRKELEARAALPDLVGRLHLVGLEKQALEAMAAMDLFLLSSRGEGLPNVLVEAQAMGVPVVTTRVGGAPEALDDKHTGWVLSSDNPDIVAAEIVRLLRDEFQLRAAGKVAPEFVKKHFGLERMLDETLAVYGNQEHQPIDEKQLAIQ